MKPIRIQRKRTPGWKAPENTVNVTRPGKWGNPFKVIKHKDGYWQIKGITSNIDAFKVKNSADFYFTKEECVKDVVRLFEKLCKSQPEVVSQFISELKGKNLMCFCALDQPCHADVLLRLANE